MARKVTITLPDDLLESIRERADERGVSAYVTEAVRHRDDMDKLRELGDFLDSEYGPASPEDIEAARTGLGEALWGDNAALARSEERMTRRRSTQVAAGTVLLDSEALARLVNGDRQLHALVKAAPTMDTAIATSAMTLLEAWNPQRKPRQWEWGMSRIRVLHTDDAVIAVARTLMSEAGMHGHKYAIDAVLAAFACTLPGPVAVYTCDLDDLSRLLAGRPIAVKQL